MPDGKKAKPGRQRAVADAAERRRETPSGPPSGDFDATELRELVDLGADWLWETDADLRFTWISPEFGPITGVDPKDVLGSRRVDMLVRASRGSKSAGAHLEALEAHKPFRNFVYRLKGSRREGRWVSVSGNPRYDEHGGFMGYRGVGHNVTDLVASFEELQQLHSQIAGTEVREKVLSAERAGESHVERMMDALDVMSDAFCFYDADGAIVLYNEALVSMYDGLADVIRPGLTFAEFIDVGLDRGFWDLEGLAPADWRASLLAGRKDSASARSMIRLADGRVYVHREVRTTDGGTIATCTDITELENRQAALTRASEETRQLLSDLERALDSMTMGVVLLDADLNATIINKAFYEIWSVGPQDVAIGSPFRALMDVNRDNGIYDIEPNQWESYVASRLAEIRAGDVAPREFQRADGRTIIYSVTALSEGKRLVCYYDVSEMKNREAELAAALERSQLAESVINSVKDPDPGQGRKPAIRSRERSFRGDVSTRSPQICSAGAGAISCPRRKWRSSNGTNVVFLRPVNVKRSRKTSTLTASGVRVWCREIAFGWQAAATMSPAWSLTSPKSSGAKLKRYRLANALPTCWRCFRPVSSSTTSKTGSSSPTG